MGTRATTGLGGGGENVAELLARDLLLVRNRPHNGANADRTEALIDNDAGQKPGDELRLARCVKVLVSEGGERGKPPAALDGHHECTEHASCK